MHPSLISIYDRMPVPLQDLAISAYGMRLRRTRYGRESARHRQQLDNFYLASPSKQESLQNELLRGILTTAFESVPYYQSLGVANRIDLTTVTARSLPTVLPILDRSVLRARNSEFFSTKLKNRDFRQIGTSGTSGSPLNVRVSIDALKHNYAHFYRFLNQAGVDPFERSATFAGRTILGSNVSNNIYWRRNFAMNDLLCSSYHISRDTAHQYLCALGNWNPTYIDSYPSAIYELALAATTEDIKHTVRPKCIITSSETLFDYQRKVIEDCFKCKVYDHYGNAEMGAWITETSNHEYQASPTYSIVEVVREDGQPAQPGETGELVCTNLFNHAMPLLRYRIGDRVRLASNVHDNSIGAIGPVIQQIEGRTDDTIILADGTRVGRLDPVFKGVTGIVETQIIQKTYSHFEIKYVPDTDFDPQSLKMISSELHLRLGSDSEIDFIQGSDIPKTSSGKMRAVVSELGN